MLCHAHRGQFACVTVFWSTYYYCRNWLTCMPMVKYQWTAFTLAMLAIMYLWTYSARAVFTLHICIWWLMLNYPQANICFFNNISIPKEMELESKTATNIRPAGVADQFYGNTIYLNNIQLIDWTFDFANGTLRKLTNFPQFNLKEKNSKLLKCDSLAQEACLVT